MKCKFPYSKQIQIIRYKEIYAASHYGSPRDPRTKNESRNDMKNMLIPRACTRVDRKASSPITRAKLWSLCSRVSMLSRLHHRKSQQLARTAAQAGINYSRGGDLVDSYSDSNLRFIAMLLKITLFLQQLHPSFLSMHL